MKRKLQYLWWSCIGNPWWWLMISFCFILVLIIVSVIFSLINVVNILNHPEEIGRYIGEIGKGIESVK